MRRNKHPFIYQISFKRLREIVERNCGVLWGPALTRALSCLFSASDKLLGLNFRAMRWILLFSILGMALSSYAVYVEHMKAMDDSFKALCDMNETISCSKVFSSEFGKILSYWGLVSKDSVLDQPNAVFGMIFYLTVIVASEILKKSKASAKILLLVASAGVALSAYLAYVLVYHLHDFCLVCTGSYICNAVIFVSACIRYRNAHASKADDKVA